MGGGEKKHKRKHDVADGANEKPKDVKKEKKKKKDSKKNKDAKSPIPKFGKKVSKSKVRSKDKKKSKHGEPTKENMPQSVPPTPNPGRIEEVKNRMPAANMNHRKARKPTEAVPPRSDDARAKEMKRQPQGATKNPQMKSDRSGEKYSSDSKSSNKIKQKELLQPSPAPSTPAQSFLRPNSKEKSKQEVSSKENMSKSVPPTPNDGSVEQMKNRMPAANMNHRKARKPAEAPPRSDDVRAKELKRMTTAATKNPQMESDRNKAKLSSNSKSSNKKKMLQQSPAPSTPAHSFVRPHSREKSKHEVPPKENMPKSVPPPTPNDGRVEQMKNRMPAANMNHRKARKPAEAPPVPPRSDDVRAKEINRQPTAATKNPQMESDRNEAKHSSNSKSSNRRKQKMLQQSPSPSKPAHSFVRPNSKEKSKNVHEYFPNPDGQIPRKNPDKNKEKKEKSSSKSKSAKIQKSGSKKHGSPKMLPAQQQKSSEKLRKEVVDKEKLKDGKEKQLLSHSKSSKKEKVKKLASPKNVVKHEKSAEKLHHRTPKRMTPKKKERTLLVNINEILQIGSVLEKDGMDEQRRKAFEWLAEHRSESMKDSPKLAYNLMVAIGDLTLTQNLVSHMLQCLLQEGVINQKEYQKHFAPLERSSARLTITEFAHLLKIYGNQFQSSSELQSSSS